MEGKNEIAYGWGPGQEIPVDIALKKMVEAAKVHAAVTGRSIANITIVFADNEVCGSSSVTLPG